jgi:hypothetical protein
MTQVVSWRDIKVAIGLCNSQDVIPSDFMWSFLNVLRPNKYVVIRGQHRHKAAALNHIVREAHLWGTQKVLFLDVDQVFPFDVIPKLLSRNQPVVSGLTYMRGRPYSPLAGWKKGKKYVNQNGDPWKENFADFPDNDNHLIEVDWTSVGCLMVDMDVFNKIYFPCFYEKWSKAEGVRSKGHDLIFCEAVKKAGYKVYVDTLVQCGHLHNYTINDVYVKAYHASDMHSKQVEVIKKEAQEKKYWDERHFADSAKNLKRTYSGEWHYIMEQINEGASVAEIGCGPGFLMEMLKSKKNCECYGYDLSGIAIDAVKERGFKGEVADFRTFKPNGEAYDYVVASHLLEHMEDDKGFLLKTASMLKDDSSQVIVGVPTENLGVIAQLEHCQIYSKRSLTKLMKEVFKEVNVDYTDRKLGQKSKSPMLVAIGSKPHERI